jgi:hypothetical protein
VRKGPLFFIRGCVLAVTSPQVPLNQYPHFQSSCERERAVAQFLHEPSNSNGEPINERKRARPCIATDDRSLSFAAGRQVNDFHHWG